MFVYSIPKEKNLLLNIAKLEQTEFNIIKTCQSQSLPLNMAN